MIETTKYQIELMQHALGINENRREPYRNYFLASGGHNANADLESLHTAGLMTSFAAPSFCAEGDVVYHVTDAGRAIAFASLPAPKTPTRYEEYLHADCGYSFAEFLGIDVPEIEYGSWYPNRGKFRMVSRRATGEWCDTQKEAKSSYKEALKANKTLRETV
ncbi:hypothetical protein J1782_24120 [Rahnella sp. BCC 1045]|uniref:hypothetical protein n=1 Tax=Rahnella sp. BCC 1045 TaxID=2816251 RepID=UPI001C271A55|nr:hypothetical protein [Rahnella sp. BCC 1045]MBU9822983.1 hypothetical protein [Rahnella sp. BCC 1045]